MFTDATASTQHFFANYISTVLNAPMFEPIQESKTVFLPQYHAHSYGSIGSRNVIMLRNNIDLRLEGYVFLPYRELLRTEDLKTEYGKPFDRRYYIASLGTVYHSPLGPIALFLNYYEEREKPFSVMFHFGYFIFNKPALN